MSSYATLYFDGYEVNNCSHFLDTWLFQKSDQKLFEREREYGTTVLVPYSATESRDKQNSTQSKAAPGEEDNLIETETAYVFETSTETMLKRLEATGYTMETAKVDFESCIAKAVRRNERRSTYSHEESEPFTELKRAAFSRPFEEWCDAVKTILTNKLKQLSAYLDELEYPTFRPVHAHDNVVINWMLNEKRDIDNYNMLTFNPWYLGYF